MHMEFLCDFLTISSGPIGEGERGEFQMCAYFVWVDYGPFIETGMKGSCFVFIEEL